MAVVKLPTEMPDWFPAPGYKWMTYRESMFPTLVLVHPDHPPMIWDLDDDGDWANMRELTI